MNQSLTKPQMFCEGWLAIDYQYWLIIDNEVRCDNHHEVWSLTSLTHWFINQRWFSGDSQQQMTCVVFEGCNGWIATTGENSFVMKGRVCSTGLVNRFCQLVPVGMRTWSVKCTCCDHDPSPSVSSGSWWPRASSRNWRDCSWRRFTYLHIVWCSNLTHSHFTRGSDITTQSQCFVQAPWLHLHVLCTAVPAVVLSSSVLLLLSPSLLQSMLRFCYSRR